MSNKLIGLYVEIISKCNARCAYCYNAKALDENHIISPTVFAKIVDSAKEAGISRVAVSGGEPMLHEGLCKMIDYACSKGISVMLITNLTLYDKKVYDLLCKHRVSLQITLDGHTAQIHDYTRGVGTFEKIIRNISSLFELGYNGMIHMRINLHKMNYQYVENIVALAKKHKATDINLAMINNIGAATNFYEAMAERDYDILNQIAVKVEEINNVADDNVKVIFNGLKASLGCPYYGKENLECGFRIAADGYVYPCQLFTDKIFNLGNINYEFLEKIINGKKLEQFHTLMNLRKHYIPECQECVYKSMCATGCPAKSYNDNGNIFSLSGECSKRRDVFTSNVQHFLSETKLR